MEQLFSKNIQVATDDVRNLEDANEQLLSVKESCKRNIELSTPDTDSQSKDDIKNLGDDNENLLGANEIWTNIEYDSFLKFCKKNSVKNIDDINYDLIMKGKYIKSSKLYIYMHIHELYKK